MQEREQQQAAWKDYYAILGVGPGADSGAIEAAYADLCREGWVGSGDGEPAEEHEALVEEAFECLCDPASRARYDRAYMTRRRKGMKPLPKRSLSQIMLICPECDSADLYSFKRSQGHVHCARCGTGFFSRVGELEAMRSERTGFRWYYTARIRGLYDGKRQQVNFDLDFKIPCSELPARDSIALTYRGPEFGIIQNLTTNHYWRLVGTSTAEPRTAKRARGGVAGLFDTILGRARR